MPFDEDTFYSIVSDVLVPLVAIFGIVGNISSIVVFARQHPWKPFNALMLFLAIFDLILVVVRLIYVISWTLVRFSPSYNQSTTQCWTSFINYIFYGIGMYGSVFFTLALTVERYVTVCHPFYR